MALYDISSLQGPMGKPYMTTDELDAYLADPKADDQMKVLLLNVVRPQGYQTKQ